MCNLFALLFPPLLKVSFRLHLPRVLFSDAIASPLRKESDSFAREKGAADRPLPLIERRCLLSILSLRGEPFVGVQ